MCDMDMLKCVPEAGDRPVRENANPANPGTAGDRPGRGNADPEVSGTGRATTGYRDTAGDRPVRENANVKVLSETPMQTTQSMVTPCSDWAKIVCFSWRPRPFLGWRPRRIMG